MSGCVCCLMVIEGTHLFSTVSTHVTCTFWCFFNWPILLVPKPHTSNVNRLTPVCVVWWSFKVLILSPACLLWWRLRALMSVVQYPHTSCPLHVSSDGAWEHLCQLCNIHTHLVPCMSPDGAWDHLCQLCNIHTHLDPCMSPLMALESTYVSCAISTHILSPACLLWWRLRALMSVVQYPHTSCPLHVSPVCLILCSFRWSFLFVLYSQSSLHVSPVCLILCSFRWSFLFVLYSQSSLHVSPVWLI